MSLVPGVALVWPAWAWMAGHETLLVAVANRSAETGLFAGHALIAQLAQQAGAALVRICCTSGTDEGDHLVVGESAPLIGRYVGSGGEAPAKVTSHCVVVREATREQVGRDTNIE